MKDYRRTKNKSLIHRSSKRALGSSVKDSRRVVGEKSRSIQAQLRPVPFLTKHVIQAPSIQTKSTNQLCPGFRAARAGPVASRNPRVLSRPRDLRGNPRTDRRTGPPSRTMQNPARPRSDTCETTSLLAAPPPPCRNASRGWRRDHIKRPPARPSLPRFSAPCIPAGSRAPKQARLFSHPVANPKPARRSPK